jgi:hypothetical protein
MPKGVRLNPQHDQRTRAKIQTSQIINRLEGLVFGTVEMSSEQVQAAKILLAKTLPDMKQIEHAGETTHRVVSEAPPTAEEWAAKHAADDKD